MSGICGLVMLDGRDATASDLDPVLDALAQRGPDGRAIWSEGIVALGAARNFTTPEAPRSPLPFHDQVHGLAITGAIRLDNLDELRGALGIAGDRTGDSETVLRAYQTWGDRCAGHLKGDFAFALWDSPRQRLFAARDPIGVRQISYAHRPGEFLLFATDYQAVAAHPGVPKVLSERRVGDLLENLEYLDLEATFFEGVFRLRAGHILVCEQGRVETSRYFERPQPALLELATDEEYADAVLLHFKRAVQRRMRSFRPIGSMLSGGLDSSSVSAVASQLLSQSGVAGINCFSAVSTDPGCKESAAIAAMADTPGIIAHRIPVEGEGADISRLKYLARDVADPFDAWMTALRAVYDAAQQKGLNVVLDGALGDLLLEPTEPLEQLLRAGKFGEFARELRGTLKFWGVELDPTRFTAATIGRAFVPRWLRQVRSRMQLASSDRQAECRGPLNPNFARTIALASRKRAARRQQWNVSNDNSGHRSRNIFGPMATVGRERYDRVAGQFGIEARDPFTDLDLIDFCLSIPPQRLQSDGFAKAVMRRAMAGILPDAIRWRRGKEHLGAALTQRLLGETATRLASTSRLPFFRQGYIPTSFEEASPVERTFIINAAALIDWMRTNAVLQRQVD